MTFIKACMASFILLSASSAFATDVNDATANFPSPDMGEGFAILTSDKDDTLTGFTSPCCDAVELHTMSMKDGVMRMRHIEKLDLKAGVPVLITGAHGMDNSMHIMLMGIHKPLKAGDTFPVTFQFAAQKPYITYFTVTKRGAYTSH